VRCIQLIELVQRLAENLSGADSSTQRLAKLETALTEQKLIGPKATYLVGTLTFAAPTGQ